MHQTLVVTLILYPPNLSKPVCLIRYYLPYVTSLTFHYVLVHSRIFYKQAHVKPLLKKITLDPNCFKNFRPVSNLTFTSKLIPASDWLPKNAQYVKDKRKQQWDDIETNKLKEIVPDLTEHHQLQYMNRRDEVVLTRLRIGHSRLTHSYLMESEPAPRCIGCDSNFTI